MLPYTQSTITLPVIHLIRLDCSYYVSKEFIKVFVINLRLQFHVTLGRPGIDLLQTEFVQDNSITEPMMMYQTTFYLHEQIKGTIV